MKDEKTCEKCDKLMVRIAFHRLYIYRIVNALRSLGINVPYPEGAKTFKEFLERDRVD